jgi:hypothetical protein
MIYQRYPDSLVMGLSKIGGLFFFINIIALLLYCGHYYVFEWHLTKYLNKNAEVINKNNLNERGRGNKINDTEGGFDGS